MTYSLVILRVDFHLCRHWGVDFVIQRLHLSGGPGVPVLSTICAIFSLLCLQSKPRTRVCSFSCKCISQLRTKIYRRFSSSLLAPTLVIHACTMAWSTARIPAQPLPSLQIAPRSRSLVLLRSETLSRTSTVLAPLVLRRSMRSSSITCTGDTELM